MPPEPQFNEHEHVRRFLRARSGDFLATLLVIAPFASWLIHRSTFCAVPASLVLAVGLPWWWRLLGRRALTVTDEGLTVTTLFGSHRLAWSECYYAYLPQSDASTSQGLIEDAAINLAKTALRHLRRRQEPIKTKLTVTEAGGPSVCVDDYAAARESEAVIVAHIHRCSGNETIPFEVLSTEIRHRGEVLPFSQLERVAVGSSVDILRADVRSAWASVSLGSVHNVWLLLERLLERGVTVELAIEAPPSIIAAAEAAALRHANMPRATIARARAGSSVDEP